jgi:hypothetical protein
MKKILLITLVFLSLSSNAQFGFKKAKIYLKDGTSQVGFAKFKFLDSKIKFKVNKKDDAKTLSYIELDKFTINDTEYDYKITNKSSAIKLFRVKQRGKVSLYYQIKTNQGAPMGGMPGGISMSITTSSEVYFIAKNDNDKLTKLFNLFGPSKKVFKKIVPVFFSDCPALLDKIDDKKFKKRDIVKM